MNILNKRDYAYSYIIRSIFSEEELSVESLIYELNISKSTFANIINELNEIIYPIQIKYYQNTIKLIRPPEYSFDFCIAQILKNSLEYSIMELLFFEQHPTYLAISDELFVSESTIKRIIGSIRPKLKEIDIILQTKPLCITGNETNIRYFFMAFFKEKYGFFNLPFPEGTIKALGNFYRYGAFVMEKQSTAQQYIRFILSTAVSYERELRHHRLDLPNSLNIKFLKKLIDTAPNLITELERPDDPNDTEFYIRIFYLFTNNTPLNLEINNRSVASQNQQIAEFLSLFCDIFKLQIDKKQLDDLSLEIFEIIYNFKRPIESSNFVLTNQFKEFYQLSTFFMESYHLIMKEIYEYCFSEEFYSYFYIVFFAVTTTFPHLLDTLYDDYSNITITLLIDFDFQFSNYLKNKLEKLIPGSPHFNVISTAKDLNISKIVETTDLLITNILDITPFKTSTTTVISISHYLTQQDLTYILNAVQAKYKKNHMELLTESSIYFTKYNVY
ncbi:helix-turn-helix domain-containing protein [Enterococcus sp. BWT-B8]|uniref:helix-turn-helix domain-containing protein n=1 Tax=unclassified Enterococcus TaxID=2608891 RepID=UPI001E536095|nr:MULTISPECIES: helix-turn-helix domain-containing protein [unclassified Enterococcus]MCB5952823.1 helix-turn-helix domain-containing protein [Enterococcus sp. BWT-B8]MCB5953828.1 helix-turn-helix domain-containing protein [Enterococcus sp. CWB-B31]